MATTKAKPASKPRTARKNSNGDNGGTTQRAAVKSDPLKDRRDSEGNLIDPPTIPEYEQKLAAAHAAVDVELIADITEEYNQEREKLALAEHDRAQRRAKREREARGD